eukprot:4424904-Prymnesium_polylepis.1
MASSMVGAGLRAGPGGGSRMHEVAEPSDPGSDHARPRAERVPPSSEVSSVRGFLRLDPKPVDACFSDRRAARGMGDTVSRQMLAVARVLVISGAGEDE